MPRPASSPVSVFAQSLALALLLAGVHGVGRAGPRLRIVYAAVSLAVIVTGAVWLSRYIHVRIGMDIEFDFLNYWLAAQVAADGQPLYDPSSYLRQSLPFIPSDAFFDEVLFVGTMYPPPAVLLFLPLGGLGYREGYALWCVALAAMLAALAVLLQRTFGRGERAPVQVAVAIAVLGIALYAPAVRSTFYYAQVNFVLALLLVGLWRWHERALTGVLVGLGMCVKPYFGIVCLWLVLRRRWGALALVPATVLAAFLGAALVLGPDAVFDYWRDNPVARAPASIYVQPINQGLLAVLRRMWQALAWDGSPLAFWPYVLAASGLLAATVVSVLRATDERYALSAVVALGLLIAPQSLTHYSAVLIPVFALLALPPGSAAVRIVVVVALCTLPSLPNGALWLNLAVWCVSATHPAWAPRGDAPARLGC